MESLASISSNVMRCGACPMKRSVNMTLLSFRENVDGSLTMSDGLLAPARPVTAGALPALSTAVFLGGAAFSATFFISLRFILPSEALSMLRAIFSKDGSMTSNPSMMLLPFNLYSHRILSISRRYLSENPSGLRILKPLRAILLALASKIILSTLTYGGSILLMIFSAEYWMMRYLYMKTAAAAIINIIRRAMNI